MKNRQKILFLISLMLSLGGAAIHCILLLGGSFDTLTKLYDNNALYKVLIAVACAAGVCALVQYFFCEKFLDERSPGESALTRSASIAVCAALIALALIEMINGISTSGLKVYEKVSVIGSAIAVYPAALYFMYNSVARKKNKLIVCLSGIGAMAWCAFSVMKMYYDMTYPIASGARIFHTVSMLSMMMFVTAEVGYFLGQGKRRMYIPFAMLFIFFSYSYCIPMLFIKAGSMPVSEMVMLIIEGIGAVYALIRIISIFGKTVEEKKMDYVIKSYKSLSDVDWKRVERAKIDKWGWGYEYKPECYAQCVYTEDKGLAVLLTAKEKEPHTVRTEFMSDVCCDSCMEFFFSCDRVSYTNFEFNSIGTMHASCGAPGSRVSIDKLTEMPFVKAEVKDDSWRISLILSHKNFKDLTGVELARGLEFFGNFYKCGDECEQIHYGMWNEVKTEKPSFHQPGYFGNLYIG